MRSFDVRCTSYNPGVSGKYKTSDFILRCFFDTGRRWEAYEPPRAGTLVHIIGQLIGRYKVGHDEKPAVLITDFRALVLSGNMHTAGGDASSPETTSPLKRRYGPKSSRVLASPVTPRNGPAAVTSGGLGSGDADSHHTALSSPVSGEQPSVPLSEGVETPKAGSSNVSGTLGELDSNYPVNNHIAEPLEIEDSVTDSQRQRPKRIKSGKSGRRGWGSPDF